MVSLTGCAASRAARGFAFVALAWLVASCTPADSVAPGGCPAICPNANLVPGPAPEFFVSAEGSPSGDGSFAKPWDLATALAGPPDVTPGSTIWLRGGTYANGPYFGEGYLS